MNATPASGSKAIAVISGLCCIGAILAMTGYWMLFSNFAPYDDEGYVLISARDYFTRGGLYDVVYTQYGPAFYVLMDALQHLLGSPVDNTSARLLTLALWLGTASASAALVMRANRSATLGLFTLIATFLYLYFLVDEPFHPGGLIVIFLPVSLWLAAAAIQTGRQSAAMAVLGMTGATLLLTKINVGIFFISGVAAWSLPQLAPARYRSRALLAVLVALCLLAAGLMHGLAHEPWVWIYLTVFALGAAALVLTLGSVEMEALQWRRIGIALGAAAAVVFAVLMLVWLRGTTLSGLLQGVLLGPLKHPSNYSYAVDWRPGTLPVAVLSLTLAVLHVWLKARNPGAADRMLVGLRLAQFAAVLAGIVVLMKMRVIGALFSYEAALIWTWVVPLSTTPANPALQSTRTLLACVLLLQYLHAYPVGGSQMSWGTFLFLPLVALGLDDIRGWLVAVGMPRLRFAWRVLSTFTVLALLAKAAWTANHAWQSYRQRSDLALPGASALRLTENLRTAYRILSINAVIHGDVLFTLPGMFSFNIWTDLPTPTPRNTTLWFTLLDAAEQRAIIRALEEAKRPCVIVQETQLFLLQSSRVPIEGELVDYIQRNFAAAFRLEGFAFLVRAGSQMAPIDIARTIRLDTPPSDIHLTFNLLAANATIVSIELRPLISDDSVPLVLDATNSRVSTVPINRSGLTLHEPIAVTWPWTVSGLTQINLRFSRQDIPLSPGTSALYLRAANGEVIGTVRIVE